jgi:periplasmic protein TonB
MSATTVNAFPPLHNFNSSRSWFMALIVLLHAGFFWVLTHGVTIGGLEIAPPVIIDFLPDEQKPEVFPKEPEPPAGVERTRVDPVPLPPDIDYRDTPAENAPQADPHAKPIPVGPGSALPVPPVIVQPQGDPRFPLTEPEYPAPDIRMGHEGTVWLTIEILPNGRVGAVRIDQTSGFARLDDAAVREARKWRMKPGTQDGIAIAMYKRVPVTFRLKD